VTYRLRGRFLKHLLERRRHAQALRGPLGAAVEAVPPSDANHVDVAIPQFRATVRELREETVGDASRLPRRRRARKRESGIR
jgi:hypothetical protein